MAHKYKTHNYKTNCTAYVIAAIDKNTGLLEGYYSNNFEITPTIWYAKFLISMTSANECYRRLLKSMPETIEGEPLKWKIQEVSMNEPFDVK